MKRHCWSYQVGVPRGRLFPSGLCLSAISRVVLAWPDPLPTGLNGDGKNVQTLWWAELDRLHSMTRAHPPLGLDSGIEQPQSGISGISGILTREVTRMLT